MKRINTEGAEVPEHHNREKDEDALWYAKRKGFDVICKNCGMRFGRHNGKTSHCPVDEYSETEYRETKFLNPDKPDPENAGYDETFKRY